MARLQKGGTGHNRRGATFWTSSSASRLDNGRATLARLGREKVKVPPSASVDLQGWTGDWSHGFAHANTRAPSTKSTARTVPNVQELRKVHPMGGRRKSRVRPMMYTKYISLSSKQNSKGRRGDVDDDGPSRIPYLPPIPQCPPMSPYLKPGTIQAGP